MDNNIRGHILKIRTYAQENRIPLAEMEERVNDKKGRFKPPGDDPNRTIDVPLGYRVSYTIEEQKFGWCHHISVSIDMKDPGKPLPSLAAVAMLMIEFGMRPLNQKTDIVYIEDTKGGEVDGKQSVNIIQTVVHESKPRPAKSC